MDPIPSARDNAVSAISSASKRDRFVDDVGGTASLQDLVERVRRQPEADVLAEDDATSDRAADAVAAALVAVEALRVELSLAAAQDLALDRAASLLLEAGALVATVHRMHPFKDRVKAVRNKSGLGLVDG